MSRFYLGNIAAFTAGGSFALVLRIYTASSTAET
jgi:hypothetical protein